MLVSKKLFSNMQILVERYAHLEINGIVIPG